MLVGCSEGQDPPSGNAPAVFVEGADQVMVGVESFITDSGIRRARLLADTAFTFDESGRLEMRVVELTFFGEAGDTLGTLTGDSARYELEAGDVRVRGDVRVVLSTGEVFEGPVLEYVASSNKIHADSGYVYTLPDGTVDRGEYLVYDLSTEERRYGPGRTTTPEVAVPQ